ncbi:MAG: hypothetical protein K2Q25_04415 [Mycobacteriaceae bacterium]|nr:hypothetical protein [Mycobacteriaceae bacterium]
MASEFDMDPAATRSGLSSSDAAASAQPGSIVTQPPAGGYTTPLVDAVQGVLAERRTITQVRATTNAVNREVSVAAVEIAETTNSSALSS